MLCSRCLWLVGLLENSSLNNYTRSSHVSMASVCLTASHMKQSRRWGLGGGDTLCSSLFSDLYFSMSMVKHGWVTELLFLFIIKIQGAGNVGWAQRPWVHHSEEGREEEQSQSSCLELRAQWRQIILGMVIGLETSKPHLVTNILQQGHTFLTYPNSSPTGDQVFNYLSLCH